MKISNLRIEKRDDQSYLTVDISTQFTPPDTINCGFQCHPNTRIG